jgi:tRNA A37 N6-isopentenylltransferase MiaA
VADTGSHLELVAALKHDLAKYVAWRSANYPDDAWEGPLSDELLEALRDDILTTKGQQPAWAVWDEFDRSRDEGWTPEELEPVRRAVEVLRGVGDALEQRDAEAVAAARSDIRAAQQTIRTSVRDLHRRLLREE